MMMQMEIFEGVPALKTTTNHLYHTMRTHKLNYTNHNIHQQAIETQLHPCLQNSMWKSCLSLMSNYWTKLWEYEDDINVTAFYGLIN